MQPFILAARHSDTGKTRIVVKETVEKGTTLTVNLPKWFPDLVKAGFRERLLDEWKKAVGDDLNKFLGWDVVEIDGIDAVTAVKAFADTSVGLSHTPQTRFNFALASTQFLSGRLRLIDGPFSASRRLPSNNTRTYLLRDPVTLKTTSLTVPWLGYFRETFSEMDTATYTKEFCRPNENISGTHHLGGTMQLASVSRGRLEAHMKEVGKGGVDEEEVLKPLHRYAKFDRREEMEEMKNGKNEFMRPNAGEPIYKHPYRGIKEKGNGLSELRRRSDAPGKKPAIGPLEREDDPPTSVREQQPTGTIDLNDLEELRRQLPPRNEFGPPPRNEPFYKHPYRGAGVADEKSYEGGTVFMAYMMRELMMRVVIMMTELWMVLEFQSKTYLFTQTITDRVLCFEG
ncbi:hypothetical protein BC829DRAFT_288378 [Chytridium lagenaria]|nr:hypothetical protein BC829DRAFT_288378 [Chytridium lagenaria]